MKFWNWIWKHRTKVIGYLGQALAALGVSGIIEGPKTIAIIAYAASLCTSAVGHFNDYQANKQEPANAQE
jgi:hypothetical protein